MFMNGCIIHHNIADRLARVCGATQEERDSIVSFRRRGSNRVAKATSQKKRKSLPVNAKCIVAVDRVGNVIHRFDCVDDVLKKVHCSGLTLSRYCNRTINVDDEFSRWGFTFRYGFEWDAMTPEERFDDIQMRKEMHNAGKQNTENISS